VKELGKLKERYDFSFDARQLGLYLFAASVILALAFVLGMSVGVQWERKKAAVTASQPAPAKAPAPAPKPEVPVVPVAPPVAPPVTVPDTPPVAEPAAQPEPPAPATARPGKKPPVTVEKPAKQADSLTFPKVLTSNTKKTAPMTPEKKKAGASAYTVQVGAYNEKGAAQEFANKLKKKGYDARVETITGGKGGYVYKVRVGNYDTRDEAKAAAGKLESAEKLAPYVTQE